MSYYKEAIIKHIVTNVATEGKEAYQKFFNSALAKFGVKSPSELSDEKKKEFFNYIDDNYKAKNESTKEYEKTLDKMARDKKLKMLSKKDKVLLVKIADLMKTANEGKLSSKIKKAILIAIQMSGNMTGAVKKIEKIAKGLSDDDQVAAALRLANESVNEEIDKPLAKYVSVVSKNMSKMFIELGREAKRKDVTQADISSYMENIYNKIHSIRKNVDLHESKLNELDWNQDLSRMSNEIDRLFKMAKIKVIKHIPYKRQWRSGDAALYGAFITVKDLNGEKTILPIEIDKKGIIRYAGGPNGWHKFEKIGALNMSHARPDDTLKIKTYARSIDYLKQFAKLPGFGQSVLYKKESVKEAVKDSDVILSAALGQFLETESDIRKALKKDKRVAKHIGKWDKADLEVYFDDDELVAGGDSGATIVRVKGDMTLGDLKKAILKKNPKLWKEYIQKIKEHMITFSKDEMEKLHNDGQIVKADPDGKEHTYTYSESVNESDFTAKIDAYQDAMNALDHYVDVLKKLGIKKKAKIALALLKKLQSSFFQKENMNPKLKEVSSPLVQKLDHAIEDVEALIGAANSDEANDAFVKLKPSKKALIASLKLLNKVN